MKVMYRTRDTFSGVAVKWFYKCYKIALKSGITCKAFKDKNSDDYMKLEMEGTKSQFTKYYFKTMLMTISKWKGFKRWLSFVFDRVGFED